MKRRTAILTVLGVAFATEAQGVLPSQSKSPKYVPARMMTVEVLPTSSSIPPANAVDNSLFWQVGPPIDTNRPPSKAQSSVAPPALKQAPKPKPAAPLADPEKPGVSGQVWAEFDVTEYTSRCSPSDRPEEGVKYWLLKTTGEASHFD